MMAIQHQLHSHGFTSHNLPHTRIPGIWEKLDSLYDLETLDHRENAAVGILATPSDTDEEAEEEEQGQEQWDPAWRKHDFDLPDDDYKELAWRRRYEDDRPSSPEAIEGLSRTRNVLGDDEMKELRGQYEEEDAASVKGRGKKGATTKATRARGGGRSTRSTPADGGDQDEDDEGEEEESQVDDSPQSKATKKATGKAKTTRRTRRR
jgi:MRG-binding protein